MLTHYNNSLIFALTELFPEVKFEQKLFKFVSSMCYCLFTHLMLRVGSFWPNVDNRREFFDDVARNCGFDPLIAKNWYRFRIRQIYQYKVCLFRAVVICSSTIEWQGNYSTLQRITKSRSSRRVP